MQPTPQSNDLARLETVALGLDDETRPDDKLDAKTLAWIRAKPDDELQAFWDDLVKRAERNSLAQGMVLLEFKRRLGHGQWLNWLREHWPKSERTARRLMQYVEILQDEKTVLVSQPSDMKTAKVTVSEVAKSYTRAIAERTQHRAPPLPDPQILDTPSNLPLPAPPETRVIEAAFTQKVDERSADECVCDKCGNRHTRAF